MKILICPICSKGFYRNTAAISRRDNKTYICSACGTREALEDVPAGLMSEETKKEIIELTSQINKEKER